MPVFTFRVKSSNFVSEVLTGLDSEAAIKRGNSYFQKQVDTQEVYQAGKGQRTLTHKLEGLGRLLARHGKLTAGGKVLL